MAAQTIMLWLAQGAVAFIGGKALGAILGDSTISNIESIIKAAIAEINAFTKKAIDDNEVRKLVAGMDAVMRNLRDYSLLTDRSDQLNSEFLLKDALLKSGESISQCRSLGVPAIICYVNSVSINLLARAAFFDLHRTTESAKMIGLMISEAQRTVDEILTIFEAIWEPTHRVAVADPPCRWGPGQVPGDYIGSCWVTVDGRNKEVFNGIGPLNAAEYQELFDKELSITKADYQNATTTVTIPVRKAVGEWSKAQATTLIALSQPR